MKFGKNLSRDKIGDERDAMFGLRNNEPGIKGTFSYDWEKDTPY
jgi:hypothetical protein